MKRCVNGIIVDMTADEIAERQAEEKAWTDGQADRDMAKLRKERNRLLAETDYLALSDNTMSDAMATYRQELRDITDNATSLDDVTWPTKP
ncbi:MAG: phage tail assembly chaperone [Pontibacterium sp.]